MTLGESPAVARRRVRLALRGAREERGLTQGQVAKALDWSLSKVQRIESGEVSVSTTDLRALLAYFEIRDPETVAQLMDDSRTSRRQRWFTDPQFREHLTSATLQLLQFESEATAIRTFAPSIIPGILQTPNYARPAIRSGGATLSAETVKVRHEVRMRRRTQVFDRRDSPDYWLILDESVLMREIGGPQAAAEQLQVLHEFAGKRRVNIRVLPFVQTEAIAQLGPFSLFTLEQDEDAVLYRETYDDDQISQVVAEVRHHRAVFDDLWKKSLSEAASERLILARAASVLSALDKQAFLG
jgi:transcriptional regulator with XRE-family HTH domain